VDGPLAREIATKLDGGVKRGRCKPTLLLLPLPFSPLSLRRIVLFAANDSAGYLPVADVSGIARMGYHGASKRVTEET